MSKAKYFVYFNLHKNVFSVKYKGKVIAHLSNFYGKNCEFRVSEKGRERVLKEKKKNVHAYVVCSEFVEGDVNLPRPFYLDIQGKVKYNPYAGPTFVNESGDTVEKADWVRFDLVNDRPVLTMAKISW
jgi:acyl-CoA-binding protein